MKPRVCRDCGAPLPTEAGKTRRFCDRCVRVHIQEQRADRCAQVKSARPDLHPAPPRTPQLTINEAANRAVEARMTYGQYIRLQGGGREDKQP